MSQLKLVSEQAEEIFKLTEQIEEQESLLKSLKAHRKKLADKVLLNTMLDSGLSTMTHKGIKFTVKTYINGSLPKAHVPREAAFRWLRENNLGEIIKNILSVQFPIGDDDRAQEAIEVLTDLGCRNIEVVKSVHPMTLKKEARKKLESGADIDFKVLGLNSGMTVNIRRVK